MRIFDTETSTPLASGFGLLTVRETQTAQLGAGPPDFDQQDVVRLPLFLKTDQPLARTGLLRRLSASRYHWIGDKRGALRDPQGGRASPVPPLWRQRVIVKAAVVRHVGPSPRSAIARHLHYLGREGAGPQGAQARFFDRETDDIDATAAIRGWGQDRHHFKLIVSPEHGDRIADFPAFTRELMRRVAEDLAQPNLPWVGVCHFDTGHPHAHVLLRGRRQDGRDLVIARRYIAHGLRSRAEELAFERLEGLTRLDPERRIWRHLKANHFTPLDRRLARDAEKSEQLKADRRQTPTWAALTAERLRHLLRLGLAVEGSGHLRLDPCLEPKLRGLQARLSMARIINARRLESPGPIRELGVGEHLQGWVVQSGSFDDTTAASWVIVRPGDGAERVAILSAGVAAPAIGAAVLVFPGKSGTEVLLHQPGLGLDMER